MVNCVVKNVKLEPKNEKSLTIKRKRTAEGVGRMGVCEIIDGVESVHNVFCEVCSTVVGIMDEDQVYHFFNVLPSEA